VRSSGMRTARECFAPEKGLEKTSHRRRKISGAASQWQRSIIQNIVKSVTQKINRS
jgi:hypothetical protein